MEFSGSTEVNTFTLGQNENIQIVLQWANKWGLSNDDYDLYLFSGPDPTSQVLTSSIRRQNGNGTPYEIISWTNNTGSSKTYYLRIKFYSVQSPKMLKLVGFYYGSFNYVTDGGINPHAAANSCISVGAINASSPEQIAYYSSHGPSRIYSYDANGNPLSYIERSTPTICGIDGVQTYVGMSGLWNGQTNYYFYGTSAAAPHLAGITSLLLSLNPSLTWQQVKDYITFSATKVQGMGGQNFTNAYGWGRVNTYMSNLTELAFENKSPNQTATGYNGGRRLVRDPNTYDHLVFASGGEIFYRRKTPWGVWDITKILSKVSGENNYPSIANYGNYIYVTWQRKTGTNTYDIWIAASSDNGVTWLENGNPNSI